MTHHPHPAAVAAAEKIIQAIAPDIAAMKGHPDWHPNMYGQRFNDAAAIISDAITAAMSAPSPVGETPTPRTDEATHHLCGDGEVLSMQRYDHGDWVPADFARQLERDLCACRASLDSACESIRYWQDQWTAQTERYDRLVGEKTPKPDTFSQLGEDA